MSIEDLKNALPEEAKDLRLNLGSVLGAGPLAPAQSWGIALATALAIGEARTISAIAADTAPHASRCRRRRK